MKPCLIIMGRHVKYELAGIAVFMDVRSLIELLRSKLVNFASLEAVFTGFPEEIYGLNG